MYECGRASSQRAQRSGISQDCTVSALLFVIVMSILLHDAVGMREESAKAAYDKGDLAELVYADALC